jgi:hypothetical protein
MLAVLLSAVAMTAPASAYYKTLTIDGSFGDWADVPVINADPQDNPGSVDFGDIKIANDQYYLYIYYTSFDSKALSTYISIDTDSNVATGYDIFGLGLVGSEAAWQNDYPFQQQAGVFNNGLGLIGDYFGIGAALLAPYGDFPEHELAIPLSVQLNYGGFLPNAPVFDDDNFDLLLWTDAGAGDVSAKMSYTLSAPEPTSAVIALMGLVAAAARRRV